MNRYCIIIIVALVTAVSLISGCSKSNATVFSWNYQGTHYVADSSSVHVSSSPVDDRIVAYSGLTALGIDGGTNLVIGSYTFHSVNTTGQPYMFYVVGGTVYSQSGTLNITYNDNAKMSGNFTVTYTDGSYMSGSFTDIPIR